MKKYIAFLGAAMFFVVCVSLYLMLETTNINSDINIDRRVAGDIEAKIKGIEDELSENQKIINNIKGSILELSETGAGRGKPHDTLNRAQGDTGQAFHAIMVAPKSSKAIDTNICAFAEEPPDKTDIQMLDLFERLPFDNPDGGAWKQGWAIAYNEIQWKRRKLKVFVVPHSHCDPGWLKTLEKYYSDQVRHILNHMVEKLEQHEHMTFIYAEMAFFTIWWNEVTPQMRERTKKLIESGRLEIVTGGWVMNDEANTHFFAMVDQMIEGNTWLFNQLGIKPRNGWSIDPFGYSPTMAYLLKEMGFDNMLIQRAHYAVKKEFARHKQLEFMWRQNWDSDGSTDMFCHMMPFYSYDVPHTCGPDPSVCCQFDFKRLPGGKISCPWRRAPQVITTSNVAERAQTLLDQYRKKATLYDTDVLLIPLGDDFRYDKPEEWDNQYNNYQMLFDYMNNQGDWSVEARFGTLSDYFDAAQERKRDSGSGFPTLSGDFFTYADRDDHYWSGYFTSRPFYKGLDRILEDHLRAAEIIYTLALTQSKREGGSGLAADELMALLVEARRNLGLYQHHDGITGTAKDHVVVDYGIKHLRALTGAKHVIRQAAHYLMLDDKSRYNAKTPLFDVDETRASHDSLPSKTVIGLTDEEQPVVFYNSLTHQRSTVVRVYTDQAHVQVKNAQGQVVASQADPDWLDPLSYSDTRYKISFVVDIAPLSLSKYTIQKVPAGQNSQHTLAKVVVYNLPEGHRSPSGVFEVLPETPSIVIENSDLKLNINKYTGLLDSVTLKETGDLVRTQIGFYTYGTVTSKDKSGAYLFFPNGQAKLVPSQSPRMTVTLGPVMTEVQTEQHMVKHKLRLYNSAGVDSLAVDILNLVDVRSESNKELVMRLETDVQNADRQFYSDLNGYQMIRRKYQEKLTLQGNFYPMPSAAYLEDSAHRVSLLSAQSLGVASLKQGWMEVVQDRRLMQDDNRGVGQGVTDNKLTPNRFRLLVEKRDGDRAAPLQPMGYLSMQAHLVSQELIYPLHIIPKMALVEAPKLHASVAFLHEQLQCDVHLLNLRTLQQREDSGTDFRPSADTALLLHRRAVDCSFPLKGASCQVKAKQITLSELFSKEVLVDSAQSTSLSLIHDRDSQPVSKGFYISPMTIKAYKLRLK